MAMSFDNLRVGKKYRLQNYGEIAEFTVVENMGNGDYMLKDLKTLEKYNLKMLIQFGKGKDFDLRELENF